MNEPQTEPAISEESLLRAEAQRAHAALHGALLGIKDSLIQTADPKAWAETHPWVSVGVAAATGFAAATAIVPARGERASEHWSGVMQRMTHHADRQATNGHAAAPASAAATPSIWSSVVESLFELAKVAVSNLITTMLQAKTTAVAVQDATDDGMQNSARSEVRAD